MNPPFLEEPDADVIAAAVRACPSVAALSGGRFGGIGTYLPGRRVLGVRVDDEVTTVHVLGMFGPPMVQIAAEVVVATAPHAAGRRVDVVVEDLANPDPPRSRPSSGTPPSSAHPYLVP